MAFGVAFAPMPGLRSRVTIWIEHAAAARMVDAARSLYPLETGGVLLGWTDATDRIVVDLAGSGPCALHGRHMFIPDHAWQLSHIRAAFAQSCGDLNYLGDWHSHPSGVAEMSARDDRTLTRLSRRVTGALMVIAAGEDDAWSFGAWSQRRLGLFRPPKTDPREIRLFTAPTAWPRYSPLD